MQKEESKNFDDIFKNKLQGLSSDSNPSDWIMMERLLEMEGLTQEHEATDETRFDEVALDKLNSIATAEFTPDWDRMSDMIDQMNEEPSMEPSEFDQAIDNHIKSTIVPLNMAAWDRLEPILDKDRAAVVQDLDQVAKGKLTSISEVEPAWGSMNSKINRELFLPESIVKYKVIEVALILLFAFSVAQFPVKEISEKVASARTDSAIEAPAAQVPSIKSVVTESLVGTVNSDNTSVKVDATSNESTRLAPIEEDVVAITEFDNHPVALENPVESEVDRNLADEAIWDLPPTIVDALDQLSGKPSFKFTSKAYVYLFRPSDISGYAQSMEFLDLYDQQIIENVFGTGNQQAKGFKPFNDREAIFETSAVDIAEQTTLSHSIKKPNPLPVKLANSYLGNNGLILSLFTGSDFNEIITPFDPVYIQEGTQQWNMGYSGGLSLGIRFKNWELETGAIYASNKYSPQKIYDFDTGNISSGYAGSTLRDIELEVVKIPLNFRFNVNLWDKWKVYALSGATMNMVIQSEFITEDLFIGKGTFGSPGNPVASQLLDKDFTEGLLEGGSFKNNSFFTANLGFGIERTLNNKWSVFAQPTYQRQIFTDDHIGPNQDRYNAISLFLGTRVALSKKVKK